jgi:hypothetical protein
MTYLIDTDVLINFFKHKDPAKILIADRVGPLNNVIFMKK